MPRNMIGSCGKSTFSFCSVPNSFDLPAMLVEIVEENTLSSHGIVDRSNLTKLRDVINTYLQRSVQSAP